MKKPNFDEKADEFESTTDDQEKIIVEKRTIYHTKTEYVVKVPSNIMDDIGHTQGDSLVFTLISTRKNNETQQKLTIEYEPADKKKKEKKE